MHFWNCNASHDTIAPTDWKSCYICNSNYSFWNLQFLRFWNKEGEVYTYRKDWVDIGILQRAEIERREKMLTIQNLYKSKLNIFYVWCIIQGAFINLCNIALNCNFMPGKLVLLNLTHTRYSSGYRKVRDCYSKNLNNVGSHALWQLAFAKHFCRLTKHCKRASILKFISEFKD